MSSAVTWTERNPQWVSLALWVFSALMALPLASGLVQTQAAEKPIEGTVETGAGVVAYSLPRSELVGAELVVLLKGPVPSGTGGSVRYRIVGDSAWKTVPMGAQTVETRVRGKLRRVDGVGARLPGLAERASSYEYLVLVTDGVTKPVSVTGKVPVKAQFRSPVPRLLSAVASLLAFCVMLFAIRSALEALRPDGEWEWLVWSEVFALGATALIAVPVLGWIALATPWTAVPLSLGWAENRLLLLLGLWIATAIVTRRPGGGRVMVLVAGALTAVVALLPGA